MTVPRAVTNLILGALLAACGDSGTSTSPTPLSPAAVLVLEAGPSPVEATRSSDPAFHWEIAIDWTLTETAGVGADLHAAFITVWSDADSVLHNQGLRASDLDESRLDARAQLRTTLEGIRYRLPHGSRAARVVLSFQYADDSGNVGIVSAETAIRQAPEV